MKKAFTLIELLAVIIILAVIALIATPIILNVVDSAKRRANFLTAQGLLNAAHLYYVDSIMDENKKEKVDNIDNIYHEVIVQGNKPVEGDLYATNKGLTAIAVIIDKVCYIKTFDGLLQETDQECDLGFVGIDKTNPTIEFSYSGSIGTNEWYIGDTYITAKVIDNESGASRLKWCMTDADDCEPTTVINKIEVKPVINEDTIGKKICVIGYDVQANESEKTCSKVIKVDKTSPEINGVENITINKGDSLDLRNGVTTTDNLSGIEGEFIVTPSTIDTNVVGTTTVEYKVKDLAGNETTVTRTVEVLGEAPSITFSSTGTFNSNGWSKSDFYIKAEVIDHSNKGIKSSKWCITQGESCQPTTVSSNISALVSTESGNNKICVEAIDNNAKTTTSCSNVYKLDKTKPQFSGINDVTIQKNSTIDLRSGVTVNDTTSGIDGIFTINPTSVDTSKAGTTNVTYTVSDLAGNTQIITRKIIVDALAPTATFTVQGSPINANGWSKNDFYVKVDINDQSGLGIKEAKWCISQSNTCTPNATMSGTSMTPQITVESNNNRICVQATDNNNKTSEVICSDAYKLDKTLPTAGTATFSGTIGSNSWYTSNVTITPVNGSDGLSGHSTTTTNVSSITADTSGTNITITTTDLAGNQATRNYTIKVDKTAPSKPTVIAKYNNSSGANYTGLWTNQNVWVQLTSQDNLSGIAYYQQSKAYSGGEDMNINNDVTYTTDGTRSYHYRAVDQAGNISAWTWPGTDDDWVIIQIDKSNPTISAKPDVITINPGDNYNPIDYFNVTYGASGGSTSCNPTNTSGLKSGSQTITCTATSNSGLSTTATKTINVNYVWEKYDVVSTTKYESYVSAYNQEIRIKNSGYYGKAARTYSFNENTGLYFVDSYTSSKMTVLTFSRDDYVLFQWAMTGPTNPYHIMYKSNQWFADSMYFYADIYESRPITTYSQGTTKYDNVMHKDKTTYPENGVQDEYWYVLKK